MEKNLVKEEDYLSQTSDSLRALGITYFSYGLIFQARILSSYFSNKEWEQLYRENRYDKIDPLFNGVFFSKLPLILWDALHTSGKEQKIMRERCEVCGIQTGLTIGLSQGIYTEIIAVGTALTPKEFYSLMNEEVSLKNIQNTICAFQNFYKKDL